MQSNGTELYYYRARYYRPDLGRFTSKDPMGMIDGTNMVVYVRNKPTIYDDPYGWGIGVNGPCPGGYDPIGCDGSVNPVPLPPAGNDPTDWSNPDPNALCYRFHPEDWGNCHRCKEKCRKYFDSDVSSELADRC